MSESTSRGTSRIELEDIETTADGSVINVVRIRYRRAADHPSVCPFCESGDDVEFVDEIGPSAEWRTQRFECACGAYGEDVWTWPVGFRLRDGTSNREEDR